MKKTIIKPEISVIIPTYNRAQIITKSIQSVLNQSYKDFEIIIVDDGSTDNTKEVVTGLNDKRIKYIYHEENKGYPYALNTGISIAKGDYIAFQDDDDEWLPSKLEKQMKVFANSPSNVGVVYTGFWRIKENKKIYVPFNWVKHKEGNIHKELLKNNFIGTPASIVKKECFEKIGQFDTTIRSLQDWELWLRISKHYEFRHIPEPLLVSYYTSTSISDQSPINQAEIMSSIFDKHFDDFILEKKILSNHYLHLGGEIYYSGKIKEGINYFLKSFEINPLNIKSILIKIFSLIIGKKIFDKILNIYQQKT